jgi:DNA-binding Lrp family transcriptional regulator
MDELDVKILRALIAERAVTPSSPGVKSSLRSIAARLRADDATVSYRYKRLQDAGCLPVWSLLINPALLGYRVAELMLDVQPTAAKADMVRKLKLVHEVTGIVNFYGSGLRIFMIYNNDESRARTIELISRITNAESLTISRLPLPSSETRKLSEVDVAIIRAISNDARKPAVLVAEELGLSSKTVRKRVDKLRMEKAFFPFPVLNIEGISGLIPVTLSYRYSSVGAKSSVDRAVVSTFEADYLTGSFADPETGSVVLRASKTSDIRRFSEWAESQAGIASSRVDITTETLMFPEKLIEMLEHGQKMATSRRKVFF